VRHLSVTGRSEAPPERVFAVVSDATSWPAWTMVRRASYEREGDPPPHGVGAVRRFGTGPAGSREEVVAYHPPDHFAYAILSGVPVRSYRADVRLEPDGTGTRITWEADFEPRFRGTGRVMDLFLGGVLRRFVRGLARHAAT
jgi:hypothetical protein